MVKTSSYGDFVNAQIHMPEDHPSNTEKYDKFVYLSMNQYALKSGVKTFGNR